MRRFFEIALVSCIAGFMIWDTVREFRANDPIGFFLSDPSQLRTVVIASLGGAIVYVIWSSVSVAARYRVGPVLFVPFATWISWFAVNSWHICIGWSRLAAPSAISIAGLVVMAVSFTALAIASWAICYYLARYGHLTGFCATKTVESTGTSTAR